MLSKRLPVFEMSALVEYLQASVHSPHSWIPCYSHNSAEDSDWTCSKRNLSSLFFTLVSGEGPVVSSASILFTHQPSLIEETAKCCSSTSLSSICLLKPIFLLFFHLPVSSLARYLSLVSYSISVFTLQDILKTDFIGFKKEPRNNR